MCTAKIKIVKMLFVNVVIKSVTYYQNYSVYFYMCTCRTEGNTKITNGCRGETWRNKKKILIESKKMTIFELGNLFEEISLKCNM